MAQSASVKNVFGEPVQAGDKTIIPVAQVAYGVGGGHGQGKKKMNNQKMYAEPGELNDNDKVVGEGGGVGGGIHAKPKGVYEITPTSARFIPASNTKQLLMVAGIAFMVGRMFGKKKKVK